MEEGAYTIGPVDSDGIPLNGGDIVRNPGATWFIPSEDEWYKAAFHKNDGMTANYFLYPTSSDVLPSSEAPPGGTNAANYDNALGGFPIGDMTEVGAYAATTSPYGAFDFAGNVYEWNESFRPDIEYRGIRGGAFLSPQIVIAADDIIHGKPDSADYRNGFRVATVPEPSSLALAGMALLGGFLIRRRWERR